MAIVKCNEYLENTLSFSYCRNCSKAFISKQNKIRNSQGKGKNYCFTLDIWNSYIFNFLSFYCWQILRLLVLRRSKWSNSFSIWVQRSSSMVFNQPYYLLFIDCSSFKFFFEKKFLDFSHLLEVDGARNDLRADDQPRRTGNLQRLRGGPRAVDDRSCYRAVHVGLQPVDIIASGLRRIDDAVHRDRPARRHHRGMEIGEHTLCLGGQSYRLTATWHRSHHCALCYKKSEMSWIKGAVNLKG